MRALSRNMGVDKVIEMMRMMNMDMKGDDLELIHIRAQGIREYSSIKLEADISLSRKKKGESSGLP